MNSTNRFWRKLSYRCKLHINPIFSYMLEHFEGVFNWFRRSGKSVTVVVGQFSNINLIRLAIFHHCSFLLRQRMHTYKIQLLYCLFLRSLSTSFFLAFDSAANLLTSLAFKWSESMATHSMFFTIIFQVFACSSFLSFSFNLNKTCLQCDTFSEKSWSIDIDARRFRCPIGFAVSGIMTN